MKGEEIGEGKGGMDNNEKGDREEKVKRGKGKKVKRRIERGMEKGEGGSS